MTFTYNSSTISSTTDQSQQVRLLIYDTSSGDYLFEDEEIDFFINQRSNIYDAASQLCRTAAAKFAQKVDRSVGDLKISFSQKAKHYLSLAERYETQAAFSLFAPYAGGISVSDKDTQEEDSDRVEPAFTRELHDYTTTSSTE